MQKISKAKKKQPTPSLNEIIIQAIQDKKGKRIVNFDLSKIDDPIADAFIICHGESASQVKAIADSVYEAVKQELGETPWHKEGFENMEWILLDYIDVVVHIFSRDTREFYQLEDLWSDAEITTYEDVA